VTKRDGRLVPFEADRISQALFAATEALGRPDAFLARELTDGILHFLAEDAAGTIPTTAQIAELAAKVVRELGHPTLAQTFAEGRKRPRDSHAGPAGGLAVVLRVGPADAPSAVVTACLRAYSLEAVFSRDLAAAHGDGLLTLACLDAPLELAGCILGPGATGPEAGPELIEALAEARAVTGSFVAVDGPEYLLARGPGAGGAPEFAARLRRGLAAAGLRAVVNLNHAAPPPWAAEAYGGPLFAGQRSAADPDQVATAAEALLSCCLEEGLGDRLWVRWHLGECDFPSPAAGRPAPGLVQAARAAAVSAAVTFAFDRPRRPVALGPGLDRKHPAVLLAVGLHLPRLAGLPGTRGDPSVFLQKLASLARLALSAAAQKRAALRRHSRAADGAVAAVARGFLPDRARLVVVPVGLEAAVRRLTGHGLCDSKPGLDFARQVIGRLQAVLQAEGSANNLDACLDGLGGGMAEWERGDAGRAVVPDGAAGVTGPTAWDPDAAPRSQLRAAGPLHALAGGGTAVVVLPRQRPLTADEVVELLHFAWRQTDVAGMRLVRPDGQRQPNLPGLQ
jgi:hypothetical protein